MTLHWHHATFSFGLHFLDQNRIENGFVQTSKRRFTARQRMNCYSRTRNTLIQGFSIRLKQTTRCLIYITVEKYVYFFRCLWIAKHYSHEVPTPPRLSWMPKFKTNAKLCLSLQHSVQVDRGDVNFSSHETTQVTAHEEYQIISACLAKPITCLACTC